MTFDEPAATPDSTVDRRQLLKVGAWAAPVVVLAAAVPAATASTNTPFSPTATGTDTVTFSGTMGAGQSGTLIAVLKVTGQHDKQSSWSDRKAGDQSQTNTQQVTSGSAVSFTFPTYTKHNTGFTYTWTLTFTLEGNPLPNATRTGTF
ncbi:hypothetical protein [Microbacterium hominis]|uniref:Transcriptional initiation protein Tat n=1 Tax=Microbacterium hominis TaxID=162426 RepID=A0A7D4U5T2_9MICO|nr:hypothetical protein [Microbacterium hominis]QKJ20305.1 hypothetical protein HQM25_13675 [Microbacterium hominis]